MNEIQIVSLMNLLIEWKAENMAIWEFMRANNTAPINWPVKTSQNVALTWNQSLPLWPSGCITTRMSLQSCLN